jgi:hypothetical protein
MDAEKWRRLNEQIKARQFEAGARWAISWKSASMTLKYAADRLYNHYNDGQNRISMRLLEEFEKSERKAGSRTLKLEGQELIDYRDGGLISVYFLLIGYAIENLLKGILMIKHPEYFKPDQKIVDIQSHDLVGLTKRCKIVLQQEETVLLTKLTTYVVWQGKYAIPLRSDEMFGEMKPDGTWVTRGEAFHGRKTQQEVDRLYIKLWNELERIKPAEEIWKPLSL